MKVNDLVSIIHETPRTVPVFKITKLPKWVADLNKNLKNEFVVGMLVYWHKEYDTFKPFSRMNGCDYSSIDLAASNIEFVGYHTI